MPRLERHACTWVSDNPARVKAHDTLSRKSFKALRCVATSGTERGSPSKTVWQLGSSYHTDSSQGLITKRSSNQVFLTKRCRGGYTPLFLYDKMGRRRPQCLQNGCGVDRTASTVVLPATKSFLQKDKKKWFRRL